MNQTLLFLLDDDQGAFPSLIRSFFAGIIRFLYNWISKLVDVMYSIASKDLGMGELVTSIADKIFIALIIFMIFKLTISIMTYLVEPDSFTDGNKGVQGIIKRVIISIVLLISINPIFTLLYDLQDIIIKDDIITNLIMGTSNDSIFVTSEGDRAYLSQISPFCDDIDPDARVVTFSQGDHLALLTLRPFIQPVEDDGDYEERKEKLKTAKYCGLNISDESEIPYVDTSVSAMQSALAGPHSAGAYMQWKYYNDYTGKWDIENNVYLLDFNYFFALIVGAVVCLILISFCFDVVIRSFTLMLLQVMAPIPIISYISPKGKMSEMLSTWFKKLMSTWLSLFIKMLALSVALVAIGAFCDALNNDDSGFLMQIIVIIGALMFAKKLPHLLEELIPGLKLGGFELNPFKRISKDALGGNLALGVGAAAAAAGMSGLTNGIQRTAEGISDIRKNGFSARRALGHIGKAAGSTIAGATRGGVNAFRRTSKDGNIFGGAWNGYQTSMYSKLQREDNLRKAGLQDASMGERIQFAMGSAVSDAARYVGVLNKGQKEYLRAAELDNQIKEAENQLHDDKLKFTMKKRQALEPYIEYSNYASKIKDKIENDKAVKDANKVLEDAQASGDPEAIRTARESLERIEKETGNRLLREDREVKALTNKLDELRRTHSDLLGNSEFDYRDASGNFSKGSIYNTKSQANIVEMEYTAQEKQFEVRQTQIDAMKRTQEYVTTHDENSIAKIQNASRMNNEVQPPGLKPSAAPMQSRMTDSSQYSNLD